MPPKVKFAAIPDDVAATLRDSTCDGTKLVLPPKLDPNHYRKVNAILEHLGGKWTRKLAAHVFPTDARTAIDAALGDGKVVNRKQTFQLFETPAELAGRMVDLANVGPGSKVLEPSAGPGSLVRALLAANVPARNVTAVELDPAHRPALTALVGPDRFVSGDFLEVELPDEPVDAVVMNPPFTNLQDCDHVRRAFAWLRPGGRLVAVMSEAGFTHASRKAADFREWLDDKLVEVADLPAGTFSASGTEVKTRLVVLGATFDR